MIATSAELAGDPTVIARAKAVQPAVAAAADEIEETRRLPPALLDKLHHARLFRLFHRAHGFRRPCCVTGDC